MTTGLLALAFTGCAAAAFMTGCGCDAAGNSYRAPATFTPATTQASEAAPTCDPASGAMLAAGAFTLRVTGAADSAPDSTLTIDIAGTVPANKAIPLDVPMSDSMTAPSAQTAASTKDQIKVTLESGDEIDATPVNAVIVNVLSKPVNSGDPLRVEVQIYFFDGHALDATFEAPVTRSGSCAGVGDRLTQSTAESF